MDSRMKRFFDELKGKRVTFCGIGVSHEPLIEMFLHAGAQVTACDKRTREMLGSKSEQLEQAGVVLQLGEDYLDHLDADIIFRTPGTAVLYPAVDTGTPCWDGG